MKISLPYFSFSSLISQLNWEEPSVSDLTRTISFSEITTVTILRATWRYGDERLFFLYQGIVLLDEHDLQYISHFPGIEIPPSGFHNKENSGNLNISGNALNALCTPCELNKQMNVGEYLLPFSSRGNQSFAFGHFISEVIPDMLDIQGVNRQEFKEAMRLLVYPLDEWAAQLMDIFNVDRNIVGELPRLLLSSSPLYTSYKLRVRFYRSNNRDHHIQNLIPALANIRDHGHALHRLIFLTRQSVSALRPVRWTDIDNCYQTTSRELSLFQVSAVDPAVGGPLRFQSDYGDGIADLFISAPGSAVYNVLFLTTSPILIAMETIPLLDSWVGQLADLKPYSHRIVFISRQTSYSAVNWDKSFELERLPRPRCLQAIFKYIVTATTLSSSERFVLKYDAFYLSLPLAVRSL